MYCLKIQENNVILFQLIKVLLFKCFGYSDQLLPTSLSNVQFIFYLFILQITDIKLKITNKNSNFIGS